MSTDRFVSVTILVGATDEEASLEKTVDYVMEHCRREDLSTLRIVYPKNAAADCLRTITKLEERYPDRVKGLRQRRPSIGGAMKDGFDAADGSHVMLLPGDLAVDLSAVPKLLAAAQDTPADVIKISRWLQKDSFHDYPRVKKSLNASAQRFLRVLYGSKLTDFTCPVQIMPRDLCVSMRLREMAFPSLLEIVLCPLRLGVNIREIPAQSYERQEGRSKNSAVKTAMYLNPALRIRFTPRKKLLRAAPGEKRSDPAEKES